MNGQSAIEQGYVIAQDRDPAYEAYWDLCSRRGRVFIAVIPSRRKALKTGVHIDAYTITEDFSEDEVGELIKIAEAHQWLNRSWIADCFSSLIFTDQESACRFAEAIQEWLQRRAASLRPPRKWDR